MRITVLVLIAAFVAALLGIFHIGGIMLALTGVLLAIQVWRGTVVPSRVGHFAHFLWHFVRDLTWSNLIMAWDVFTPRDMHTVNLVEVDISDMRDYEVVLLNHRINLSPGTMTVDISHDQTRLLVHDMYGGRSDRSLDLRAPIDILRGRKHR